MNNDFLTKLLEGNSSKALKVFEQVSGEASIDAVKAMLRLAILQPRQSLLYYQKLYNLWSSNGALPLKPNPAKRKIALLADFTADNLMPLVSMFCGARGVETEIELSPFDSVEQTILDPSSMLYSSKPDLVIWIMSDRWLKNFTGNHTLVKHTDLERAQESFASLINTMKTHGNAEILVTNFPGQAFPLPSGALSHNQVVGWNLAISSFNLWLSQNNSNLAQVIDLAGAVFREGGRQALGTLNYLRARMAYEPSGTITVAHELASAIAHLSGKTHRALVTDWDNTLWGGEVAELGSTGVECGYGSPNALGYRIIQENIKALKAQGTFLAGVSRNDPQVKKIFKENSELALKEEDFSSIQLGWHPKSESVSRVSEDLGVGSELMVLMEDNIFEIAQVLTAHPYIDVIFAGPSPEQTLDRLSATLFFNAVSISEEDLERSARGILLKEQRELKVSFDNIDDFLKEINIRLHITPLNPDNQARIIQMFQKSNQFNLTTRRHKAADLNQLIAAGGSVLAISYEDSFGSQGIISVVNLMPHADCFQIESWVMSCRVLNRTVEQAVFSYILQKTDKKTIQGEYIPTEKNNLVKNLYNSLGFSLVPKTSENKKELWRYSINSEETNPLMHFATITE